MLFQVALLLAEPLYLKELYLRSGQQPFLICPSASHWASFWVQVSNSFYTSEIITIFTSVMAPIYFTVAQVALTRLGDPGYTISGNLTLSMYTASGWVAVLVGILNLVLYLPTFFKEIDIADREARHGRGKVIFIGV